MHPLTFHLFVFLFVAFHCLNTIMFVYLTWHVYFILAGRISFGSILIVGVGSRGLNPLNETLFYMYLGLELDKCNVECVDNSSQVKLGKPYLPISFPFLWCSDESVPTFPVMERENDIFHFLCIAQKNSVTCHYNETNKMKALWQVQILSIFE